MTVSDPPPADRSILLVEDDDIQARLYRTMLQQIATLTDTPLESLSVEHVETLAAARDVIESGTEADPDIDTDGDTDAGADINTDTEPTTTPPFDLILLDLNLPDSSGLDTLTSVLGYTDEIPVVVLTAMDDTELGQQAVERGAQDFLMKEHVTPRLLGQTVAYAIERQRQRAEIERQRRELALLHWHVRHEYRDDAAVILGWAAELSPSDPDTQRTVSRIVDAGEHIVDLTDSIGAMVQAIETPNPVLRSVALEPVLEMAVDRLETRYDNVEFECDPTPEADVQVLADRFLEIVVRAVVHTLVERSGVSQQRVVLRPFRAERETDGRLERGPNSESKDIEGDQRLADTGGESGSGSGSGSEGGSAISAGFELLGPALETSVLEATVDELNEGSDIELVLVRTFLERYGGEAAVVHPTADEEEPVLRVELNATD
ncbi:receiver box response regulator [Natrialba magadii ATCC 43099]|uniref:Receiver box response regulator n=1 Tax=Natrialba magadii (strain ATCC 43099 / DSM 3394 / CCM 3739 / CIP 104546 / IAM 13178 / JCM 8861 / NBRC 102185 / NCIMB 2190 / MS3) TaxID=547559 RepID=D3SVK5_NATMM|nr:response regulator [Natrialba magadii]ADD05613.1 receiver box response regulator [Natrialba magadii ATCC 43099]ELY29974.1 response regulator receiver protein [Natrialba magadii ATCC 43099]